MMDHAVTYGAIHTGSEVLIGQHNSGKEVLAIGFICNYDRNVVVIDRATAARLINQLRRMLDDSYKDAINNRPNLDY